MSLAERGGDSSRPVDISATQFLRAGDAHGSTREPASEHCPIRMSCASNPLGNDAAATRRRLRVLMLSDVYFPRINGVSTSIQTFRRALEALSIHVSLVAPDYPDAPPELRVMRLPSRAVPLDPEDRLMRWGPLADLDRRLAGIPFDLVHIQTPFAAHYAGVRFARRRDLPCVVSYHTHFEEYLSHYIRFLPKPVLRAAARTLARRQCNAVDAVLVPSAPMAETLHAYGVRVPLHRLPTGLPDAQFVRGDGKRFRELHCIAPQRRVALFVGRAAHEKNIDLLLEAVAVARRGLPEILLVIAGEGPALDSLKRHAAHLRIEDHVRFVGYLPRETGLRDCYAAADLFAFASLTETQGLVLLEALAVGLPVLAIPALGTKEIVEPGRGTVAARRDAAAFAAQMRTLLSDPQALAALAGDAVSFAREWGATRQARRLAALYDEVVGARLGAAHRARPCSSHDERPAPRSAAPRDFSQQMQE